MFEARKGAFKETVLHVYIWSKFKPHFGVKMAAFKGHFSAPSPPKKVTRQPHVLGPFPGETCRILSFFFEGKLPCLRAEMKVF